MAITDDEKLRIIDISKLEPGSFLWRRANDEWCVCGHRRSAHEDTLSWGHGDCFIEDCDCMKFTWTNKGPKEEEN